MLKQASLYAVFFLMTFASTTIAEPDSSRGTPMPLEFNWSADEPIIRDRIVAGISRLGSHNIPGHSELTLMVTWVSNAVNLPAIYDLPRMERAPKIQLAAAQHGKHVVSWPDIVSSYDGAKKTIYLSEDWSGKTPAEISILIYQMVHHLQNVAGHKFECPQWREKLAYVAQEQWLTLHGGSLEKNFGIDPETYLFKTECHIP